VKLVPREIEMLPRVWGGCDWGAEQHVIIKCGSSVLIHTPGFMTWNGNYCPQRYEASSVSLICTERDFRRVHGFLGEVLWEGHWSKAKFLESWSKIEGFFCLGDEVVDELEFYKAMLAAKRDEKTLHFVGLK